MKIGVVTHAYYPRFGGVSEHVAALARQMRARGHQVTILTGHFPHEDPHEPDVVRVAPTYLIPHNGAYCDLTLSPWLPARLGAALREGDFDVVHVHEPFAPVIGVCGVLLARCPVVGTFHASAPRNRGYAAFQRPLRAIGARLAARVAVSDAARRFVARYVPGDYDVVPNGVDTGRFHPRVAPADGRRRGRPVVLFVGRLDPRKGLGVLLSAMTGLRRAVPEAELWVVGDGPLGARFRREAASLGDAVRFLGAVPSDALPHYYAAADVVVSPATGNESFGIVLLEAMASGRALVCSDIDGYRSVVTDGEDGVLVPPQDAAALADTLVAVLRDPERRAMLAHAGRRTALRYDWSAVAARMETIYARAAGVEVPAPRPALAETSRSGVAERPEPALAHTAAPAAVGRVAIVAE